MAKRKIIWSTKAKVELFEILDFYYQRNGTKTFSEKLNVTFRKSVRLLAKYSDIGIPTDIPNVRNIIEGDYSIFYKIESDTLEILSIWDNRQNPDQLNIKE
jgi:plasmid stabilization system protein ParE